MWSPDDIPTYQQVDKMPLSYQQRAGPSAYNLSPERRVLLLAYSGGLKVGARLVLLHASPARHAVMILRCWQGCANDRHDSAAQAKHTWHMTRDWARPHIHV